MPWGSVNSDTLTAGASPDATGIINLNPGELAHVQVRYTSGTVRMRYEVFTTVEDTATDLDDIPMLQGRLSQNREISFLIIGPRSFIVQIANDVDTSSVGATVKWRLNNVDLAP